MPRLSAIFRCLLCAFFLTAIALASSESVIYHFTYSSSDGHTPVGGLIADAAGNLYGATQTGGLVGSCEAESELTGCGTVFELSPPSSPGALWTETILYRFTGGNDGGLPSGPLIMDPSGNLFGTTKAGGNFPPQCQRYGCGTVFELSPPGAPGGAWAESVVHSFGRGDGFGPMGGVVRDGSGNLYGGAYGGPNYFSIIFKLIPSGSGTWKRVVLYGFNGESQGTYNGTGLTIDASGNLYGNSLSGGDMTDCPLFQGCGLIYELSPGSQGSQWTLSTVYEFTGLADGTGIGPDSKPFLDLSGNLYGTTGGDGSNSFGNVFELSPVEGGGWTETVLFNFASESDGFITNGVTLVGSSLYGLASYGGLATCQFNGVGCGTVFELTPQAGGIWSETTLYEFGEIKRDGAFPAGLLVQGFNGNLYGVTTGGGNVNCPFVQNRGCGTVFSITP